jgi:PAS domain S-box-containing protein
VIEGTATVHLGDPPERHEVHRRRGASPRRQEPRLMKWSRNARCLPIDLSTAQQDTRLQALIDPSPLALVEFGLDTRIRLWNPAAERTFGWSREEMIGRRGLPMAPPSKRAESEELFGWVRAGEWVNDFETVRQRKAERSWTSRSRPPR